MAETISEVLYPADELTSDEENEQYIADYRAVQAAVKSIRSKPRKSRMTLFLVFITAILHVSNSVASIYTVYHFFRDSDGPAAFRKKKKTPAE